MFDSKNIKGVVFDLDGTLFDTEYYQWQGWVVPLKDFGIDLSKEKYLKYAGKKGEDIEKELISDFNLGINQGDLLNEKRKLLEEWFSTKELGLMPFAREIVEYFFNNPNYKVALCSGGPRDEVILKLKRNDFLKYFEVITTSSDVKRGKPFPDIYEKAVEGLGLNNEDCLAFEDTQYGVQSAKDAGLFCFAIPSEYSLQQDFSKADEVLKSLEDVFPFFKKEKEVI
ncbi:MAG: HAD family phosphatase [Candidatus Pacebacteria bacterium]|nr:HAD family phosphatase [Candidatus Paceibacterota bacterium]MDD3918980.1 HAD family phosphatase [Candidatus Paceibacterota bacterium]